MFFFVIKRAPQHFKEGLEKKQAILSNDLGLLINNLTYCFVIAECAFKTFFNIEIFYYICYVILAFLATYKSPLFFAFHLTELIVRFPTMIYIIKSFWQPKKAIILTLALILVTNYFFTLVAYILLPSQYATSDSSEEGSLATTCDSLLFCMFVTFDMAFKSNGGIGGWFDSNFPNRVANVSYVATEPEKFKYVEYNFSRFFFDNLYNIIIAIVFMQIFSGIIIDTLASFRGSEDLKKSDQD